MMIDISQRGGALGRAQLQYRVLTLPLRLDQVPGRFNFFFVHHIGVERQRRSVQRAFVHKVVLALGVDIMVFPHPPFRQVGDARMDEDRRDRVDDFCRIKIQMNRRRPGEKYIGEKFAGAPFAK